MLPFLYRNSLRNIHHYTRPSQPPPPLPPHCAAPLSEPAIIKQLPSPAILTE
ncbi:hypothetical protein HanRHA438_Chr08g0370971 [Helianthus annuus]|nr:hypothetical protein HanHA300_Chr08g0296341 [Helianthus annuus]KAJ0555014.1 hypothetical protein HanHA89_Chr08g0314851 [Helianthus annuus]KAJ0720582.1 hypothetical protein HanLR1_Chr08g0295211 [Helianthus annuus]KAJ0899646.1 hypothetical protein HanRHA438_Chr08g0370971 [Helianthus annuus]